MYRGGNLSFTDELFCWKEIYFPCTDMAPFYEDVCKDLGWTLDQKLLQRMKAENEAELKRIDEAIEDAEKNLGETEVRDGMLKKAEYLSRIGDKVSSKRRNQFERKSGYFCLIFTFENGRMCYKIDAGNNLTYLRAYILKIGSQKWSFCISLGRYIDSI